MWEEKNQGNKYYQNWKAKSFQHHNYITYKYIIVYICTPFYILDHAKVSFSKSWHIDQIFLVKKKKGWESCMKLMPGGV